MQVDSSTSVHEEPTVPMEPSTENMEASPPSPIRRLPEVPSGSVQPAPEPTGPGEDTSAEGMAAQCDRDDASSSPASGSQQVAETVTSVAERKEGGDEDGAGDAVRDVQDETEPTVAAEVEAPSPAEADVAMDVVVVVEPDEPAPSGMDGAASTVEGEGRGKDKAKKQGSEDEESDEARPAQKRARGTEEGSRPATPSQGNRSPDEAEASTEPGSRRLRASSSRDSSSGGGRARPRRGSSTGRGDKENAAPSRASGGAEAGHPRSRPKRSRKDSESPVVDEVSSPRQRQQQSSAAVQTNEVDDVSNFSDCLVCHAVGELLCCDNCPRSYHPGCLGDLAPAASQLEDPAAKWFCHRCQTGYDRTFLDRFMEDHPPTPTTEAAEGSKAGDGDEASQGSASLRTLCRDFLECLMAHDLATEFCQPIDEEYEYYYSIITCPMDFGSIRAWMEGGEEGSPLDLPRFVADMRTVFLNCRRFNQEGSAIFRSGAVLSELFDRFYLLRLAAHVTEHHGLAIHRLLTERGLLAQQRLSLSMPHSPSSSDATRSPSFASLLIPHIPRQPAASLLNQPLYRQAAQAFFLFPYHESAHASQDPSLHHQQPPSSPGSAAADDAMDTVSSPTAKHAGTPLCSPRRMVVDPPPSPSSLARAFILSLLVPPRSALVLPLWGAPVPAGLVRVSRLEEVGGIIFRFCKKRIALAVVGRNTPTKIFQAKQAFIAMIGCLSGEGGASFRETMMRFPQHAYACSFPCCGRAFSATEELLDHIHKAQHSPQASEVLGRMARADPQLLAM